MQVDWDQPIQFANGDRCELINTFPEGHPIFPDCTREVLLLDASRPETSIWYYQENGRDGSIAEKIGMVLINQEKAA